jgi:hypothetical protein
MQFFVSNKFLMIKMSYIDYKLIGNIFMASPSSSGLQQLQLNYDQVQDRLLLSVFTQDLNEYQFWLTRRATQMIWHVLIQLLQADQKSDLEKMETNREVVKQIQEERRRRSKTAQQFSNPVAKKPLGDEPMLLFKVKAQPPEDDLIRLSLEDDKGRALQIAGNAAIVLALCQLIRQTILLANWNLDLPLPNEIPPPGEGRKSRKKASEKTEE